MDTGKTILITFFVLLIAMLVMRIVFNLRWRQQGEQVITDREAIWREGIGLFAMRLVMFFVLLAVLVL
jgi:hypothetical protein